MRLYSLLITFSCALLSSLAEATSMHSAIGFRQIIIHGNDNQPHRPAILLYPAHIAASANTTLLGDNPAFVGIQVMTDAPLATEQRPLVVISHGYGGNWRNQLWLGRALAQAGYLVLALNHPGTTSGDINPKQGGQLWRRVLDVQDALDWAQEHLKEQFDPTRVAVIGHSLGGWTAMMAAGARFSPTQFEADCAQHPTAISCKVYHYLTGGQPPTSFTELAKSWRDPRIQAVVTLDLGLARGLTSHSLAQMPVPVLVLAADPRSRQLPALQESGYLTTHLPAERMQSQVIDGASHFSFIQPCKVGGALLLEADNPGDGMICEEVGSRSREELQQQVANLVLAFLQRTLGESR